MRIALLGATGRTGGLLLAELQRRGDVVSVLTRREGAVDPAAVERVVVGSSTDRVSLADLVRDVDAVLSALGPRSKEGTLHQETARGLVDVMGSAGVRRFVGVSGAGIDVPGDEKGRRDRVVSSVVRLVGGAMARDKAEEYAVWAASDLDWTLVRPPRLVDGPATGAPWHDAHRPGRSTSISRADLAAFVADEVRANRYLRQAPFVSSGPT